MSHSWSYGSGELDHLFKRVPAQRCVQQQWGMQKCKRGGEPKVLAWMSCRKCGDFLRMPLVSPYYSIVWGQSWERNIDGSESWVDLSGKKGEEGRGSLQETAN